MLFVIIGGDIVMLYTVFRKSIVRCYNMLHKIVRVLRFKKVKKIFKNRYFSVFSSNCVGCLMLHDLGVAFNSPFVNLFIDAKDYIKYLKNPQKYNQMEFKEVKSDHNYPVGRLGELTFHFVHYPSFERAVSDFKRRVSRISYNNLFVIFCERDGCTYADLQEFDSLPYKNKIVFTHKPYNDIESSFYIEGYENDGVLGDITKWNTKIGRKVYDRFDFVNWFKTKTSAHNTTKTKSAR